MTIGQALHWLPKQAFYKQVKQSLARDGLLAVAGYYMEGVTVGQDYRLHESYNRLHDRLRSYFDFDRNELKWEYPEQTYLFRSQFGRVARASEKVVSQVPLGHLAQYIRTMSAYNLIK